MSRYCNKLAKERNNNNNNNKIKISSKKWSETTIVRSNFYDYALFLE
jgi:hypothetical protein